MLAERKQEIWNDREADLEIEELASKYEETWSTITACLRWINRRNQSKDITELSVENQVIWQDGYGIGWDQALIYVKNRERMKGSCGY
jgi:hypothetical protein